MTLISGILLKIYTLKKKTTMSLDWLFGLSLAGCMGEVNTEYTLLKANLFLKVKF